ncbi:endonuclease/exonuclease/phosphatase family protein [Flavobacterium algicola]|uniref:endonuclease/exonuclease/phosphatase family protein n=1 Tax=Flavobacterium algicola TaxID=556529 RepID=UPI001EFDAED7|nr:endonuclease/exonuclease/phosphatase family protein [Flavobacterium algicola]MCG9794174.1 endonuclease/exonuclease/phosphatase family protein [Flavobacterium algicola]
MSITLLICTILTVLVTLLPLSKNKHWIIRSMDFPRLQIMIFALALLACLFIFSDVEKAETLIMISVTGFCLLYQLWWILPYTILWSKEVKSCKEPDKNNQISFITSNVLTPNKNAEALISLVQEYRPDILITSETDLWWENQLEVLEKQMPHTIKCPLDNLYGMHLYSRLPLHDGTISFLIENDVPSIHVTIELRSGEKIRAHFLHPAPPSPTENEESTERDAELILVAKTVSKTDEPVVVTGDLNDVAWSSTTRLFRKISGLLDPRIGRGMFNTFHVQFPLSRWPMDHVFHSKHFTLHAIKRLPSIGSDHFPLYTSLAFSPQENANDAGLDADSEDQERANESINETVNGTTNKTETNKI